MRPQRAVRLLESAVAQKSEALALVRAENRRLDSLVDALRIGLNDFTDMPPMKEGAQSEAESDECSMSSASLSNTCSVSSPSPSSPYLLRDAAPSIENSGNSSSSNDSNSSNKSINEANGHRRGTKGRQRSAVIALESALASYVDRSDVKQSRRITKKGKATAKKCTTDSSSIAHTAGASGTTAAGCTAAICGGDISTGQSTIERAADGGAKESGLAGAAGCTEGVVVNHNQAVEGGCAGASDSVVVNPVPALSSESVSTLHQPIQPTQPMLCGRHPDKVNVTVIGATTAAKLTAYSTIAKTEESSFSPTGVADAVSPANPRSDSDSSTGPGHGSEGEPEGKGECVGEGECECGGEGESEGEGEGEGEGESSILRTTMAIAERAAKHSDNEKLERSDLIKDTHFKRRIWRATHIYQNYERQKQLALAADAVQAVLHSRLEQQQQQQQQQQQEKKLAASADLYRQVRTLH